MNKIILLSVFLSSLTVSSQAAPLAVKDVQPEVSVNLDFTFSFVRSHRQGNGASISWGGSNFGNVSGFVVQKTYSDPYDEYAVWEDVAYVEVSSQRTYRVFDALVYPGFNNYRIIAVTPTGDVTSDVTTVRIVKHR